MFTGCIGLRVHVSNHGVQVLGRCTLSPINPKPKFWVLGPFGSGGAADWNDCIGRVQGSGL